MVNAFQTVSLSPTSFCHSSLRSSLPCWAPHCTYVRRWQSCQPTPSSLTVIYAGHICLPPFLHVCVYWQQHGSVCGCAMWLNTFCSINKPRRGSQLASAHFSVRHVSNLLRKIFFNLAIGSRPAPFSIDPWHAWHLASGTCWRHISVHDWRQSVCALIGTTI